VVLGNLLETLAASGRRELAPHVEKFLDHPEPEVRAKAVAHTPACATVRDGKRSCRAAETRTKPFGPPSPRRWEAGRPPRAPSPHYLYRYGLKDPLIDTGGAAAG